MMRTCKTCGTDISHKSKKAIYCSDRCRAKGGREAKKTNEMQGVVAEDAPEIYSYMENQNQPSSFTQNGIVPKLEGVIYSLKLKLDQTEREKSEVEKRLQSEVDRLKEQIKEDKHSREIKELQGIAERKSRVDQIYDGIAENPQKALENGVQIINGVFSIFKNQMQNQLSGVQDESTQQVLAVYEQLSPEAKVYFVWALMNEEERLRIINKGKSIYELNNQNHGDEFAQASNG
ncbi:MAG: hypothetical protein AAF363_15745 [Bacteroidota bacterium]